jgi:hypothetical protein
VRLSSHSLAKVNDPKKRSRDRKSDLMEGRVAKLTQSVNRAFLHSDAVKNV